MNDYEYFDRLSEIYEALSLIAVNLTGAPAMQTDKDFELIKSLIDESLYDIELAISFGEEEVVDV